MSNHRHLLYMTYTLCFLHELKDKDPKAYEELKALNLNLPAPVFCKILDGLFYYKSQRYILRTLYQWQLQCEETRLKDNADMLSNWSKDWSTRFNKE